MADDPCSTRDVGDVLIGEDAARLLIEASSSGDDTALQSLLLQPQWAKIMLESQHSIYKESRPRQGPNDARKVSAYQMQNIERAFRVAVQNHHPAILSTLMAFSTNQGVDATEFVPKTTMYKIIDNEHAWVFRALASADPNIVNFHIAHGTLALYEAVRRRQTDLVVVLLEFGADPLHPVQHPEDLATYNSSLMSRAAMAQGPRMIEMLLQHGTPIAHTAALHTAARFGELDTMRLLLQHGADLNEVIVGWSNWTPMHFAASRGEVGAMKLLEESGARTDVKDDDGKTPVQLLKEYVPRET
ncbi:ankyrin [Karstenula rhodostoma CBS 690.94]|uniref:Ankyrin n=1 Tax=Karstenula rhodostoma CBS 690.94 TaxID=1392251 RepID=A0A9P4U666_9PLEO|nr:ankyrin [Karstenula rhodostoma CBS 690.94]